MHAGCPFLKMRPAPAIEHKYSIGRTLAPYKGMERYS